MITHWNGHAVIQNAISFILVVQISFVLTLTLNYVEGASWAISPKLLKLSLQNFLTFCACQFANSA